MPLAESFFIVAVDLTNEAAWVGQPVKFRIKVTSQNDQPERPFAAVHYYTNELGLESDKTTAGESSSLGPYGSWTSEELTIVPHSATAHTIKVELYQDGQFAGQGEHQFRVLEP